MKRFALACLAAAALAGCQTEETVRVPSAATLTAPVDEVAGAGDLSDIVGARGGQAEGGLRVRGYRPVRTVGLTTYWWNDRSGACSRIVTAHGRYRSVTPVAASECATAAMRTDRPVMSESPVERACKAALAHEAHRPASDTSIQGVRTTPQGYTVTLGLKGADRPWICTTNPDGVVLGVMYGGEG